LKKLILIGLLIVSELYAQDLKVMRFEEFMTLTKPKNDKIYLFNFWATYCKPCIAEMPHFQLLAETYKNKIEVVFVSLDFLKDKPKVEDFIKQKQIKQQVILLNEPDYDSWINRVSESWSGALPATLILSKTQRELYEKTFDYQALLNTLNDFRK
jgi:thiol-disulfide isomerase/thioredoxin